jgi:creatinine amidohydrolase
MWFIAWMLATLNQSLAGVNLKTQSYYGALESLKKAPVVIVTVASDAKVHGQHLPLNTDVILAQQLAKDLSEKTEAAIYPNVTVGWYPQFLNFKLVNHSSETAQRVMRETLEGLIQAGAQRILIINFDDERSSGLPIMITLNELQHTYRTPLLMLSWYDFVDERVISLMNSTPGHADELETSLMLYLAEDLVNKQKLDNVELAPSLLRGYQPTILDPSSLPGQMGNSTLATAEKGRQAYLQIFENIKKSVLAASKLKKN